MSLKADVTSANARAWGREIRPVVRRLLPDLRASKRGASLSLAEKKESSGKKRRKIYL